MRKLVSVMVMLAVLCPTSALLAAWWQNIDVTKDGGTTPAYDFEVILPDNPTVLRTINGGFATVVHGPTPDGKNYKIHWENWLGTGAPIPNGTTIHVGWKTTKRANSIIIRWTDGNGDPITDDVIRYFLKTVVFSPDPAPPWPDPVDVDAVTFENTDDIPITLDDVSVGIPDHAFPLDSLTWDNGPMNESLVSIVSDTTIQPGQTVSILINQTLNADEPYIIRFTVDGNVTTWDQMVPVPSIPTLTEWGLIILTLILLATMTYVFIRKKRLGQLPA